MARGAGACAIVTAGRGMDSPETNEVVFIQPGKDEMPSKGLPWRWSARRCRSGNGPHAAAARRPTASPTAPRAGSPIVRTSRRRCAAGR